MLKTLVRTTLEVADGLVNDSKRKKRKTNIFVLDNWGLLERLLERLGLDCRKVIKLMRKTSKKQVPLIGTLMRGQKRRRCMRRQQTRNRIRMAKYQRTI